MEKVCSKCNKLKPIDRFYTKNHMCKFCKWIKKQDLSNIPKEWDMEEVLLMLELIYDGHINYLNDLCNKINKSLEDIIFFLTNCIKICNIKMRVLINCANCGKEKETFMCKINSSNFQFCSHKCYSEFRKKYYIGEKASVFNSTEVECDYCKTKILIPEHKKHITNKYGEDHHFCSHECYSNFRKEYYIGDKLYNTGIKFSDEVRKKMSERTTKLYSEGVFNRQTIPQKITNTILDSMGVIYENEKPYKYYAVDNYLPKHNLIIEVMGDYFHANPTKYFNVSPLNKIQTKGIVRDKRKHTYINKYYNIEILYLWENDLKNNLELCKQLIEKYLECNGIIKNYHSYNYEIIDNKLKLKNTIINPLSIRESVTTNAVLCSNA